MPHNKQHPSTPRSPAQPDEARTHPDDVRQQQEQQARQSTDDQRTGKQKQMEHSMRKADVGGK